MPTNQDGAIGFSARHSGTVPRTRPYSKSASSTDFIRPGCPLVQTTGTDLVVLPPVTGGYSTADKILGFSAMIDRASDAKFLGGGYARFPGANRPSGLEEILVHVADGMTEFYMALDPAIAATQAMERTVAGLKLQPVATGQYAGQWTLDPTYATHTPVMIVHVPFNQVGVFGGIVQFIIPDLNSQYLQPG